MLTHGSLFSGIGGFDLGFERAGIASHWQVEINPFCTKVLEAHWPNVERFTDVGKCGAANLAPVDIISGGFPCQDVSVAGKRLGLSASRSGLFFEAARIIGELKPRWFVLENVPGLLSSKQGADFGVVIETLCDLGYGVAWRVLDSQYFGVAQRRRRLYIVGRFGEPCPAEILFERPSGGRDSAEGREAEARTSAEVARSVTQPCWKRHDEDTDTLVVAVNNENGPIAFNHQEDRCFRADTRTTNPLRVSQTEAVATFNSGGNSGGFRTEPGEHIVIQDVRGGTRDRIDSGQGIGIREGGPSYTLGAVERHAVAFTLPSAHRGIGNGHNTNYVGAPTYSDRMRDAPRLSEGLDYPLLPKGLDSARYRALGNAVTVSVAEWIGRRIASYQTEKESLCK